MIDKYVGIPFVDRGDTFSGADCYGLIRLIYNNDLNKQIPIFGDSCKSTRAIFSDYQKQIADLWTKESEPKMYDVIAMAHDPYHPNVVQHFGIYIGNNKMLHTLENIGSHITDINLMTYYIKGFYRWK